MKKRLLLFALLLSSAVQAISPEVNVKLKELDQVLADGEVYMQQKESRIQRLKTSLRHETANEKRFEICYTIIEEYKSYSCDSALIYINLNMSLAEKENNSVWRSRTKLQNSFVLSSAGLFLESLENIASISKDSLTEDLKLEYFICQEQLNSNMACYIDDREIAIPYVDKSTASRDSILMILPDNSPLKLYYLNLKAQMEGDYENSEKYLEAYLATVEPGTHEHARKSYSLSILYQIKGEEEKRVSHLIDAVMSDVKDAIKENKAMLDLSIWLYHQKDIQRAYNYIQYALDDANFYEARFRYFQLSKELHIITNAYREYISKQNTILKWALLGISLLFVVLLVNFFYMYKQKQELQRTRKSLNENNDRLEKLNEKLHQLNRKLRDSDQIKEEYISHFINLYSDYVDKMDEYRKTINTKIVAKQFNDLLKMTTTSGEKTDNVKELNLNFDNAFLNIYPGFVSSLNDLLKEEEQFDLKKEELNTELRVFALIRLGIDDPNKIASFLRCSVQTVYNYRSKIKRKAKNENEDIEEHIKRIGRSLS